MNNEQILRKFIDLVWNKRDLPSVPKFVAPEYTVLLDTGDPWEGKTLDNAEYIKRLDNSFGPFPDIYFEILTAVSDGDYVAITWIMTGTNLGYIDKYPPTNKKIKTNGTTIYRFKNGKVNGHMQVFDRTTVMRQLGYIK